MAQVIHGQQHAPRGTDPGITDVWINVATGGTPWSSGTHYVSGDSVLHDNFHYVCFREHGPGYTPDSHTREPWVDDYWWAYWYTDRPVFLNGSNASPTGSIPNPVPMRYRLSVGPPNYLTDDPVNIAVDFYTQHQIDIQGDVTGLSYGETVFVLPLEYTHDSDVPYHAHDDSGSYIACRLLSTGEFVWGTV